MLDFLRKGRPVQAGAMRANLDLGSMLGYFHFDPRQIENLAAFIISGLIITEGLAA
jgi:hypothetical protein